MSFSALEREVNGRVLFPHQDGYDQYRQTYFLEPTATRSPTAIVSPTNTDDIAAALSWATEAGAPVVARGGGHGAFSSADDAVVIDLSDNFKRAELRGDRIVAGGGATMGMLLTAGGDADLVVPVGAAAEPGMGLALHGGIGWLCRSYGLTVDHLVEIEMVLPNGETAILNDGAADTELWWAAKGAAPNFGVVTRAEFRTRRVPLMGFHRYVLPVESLGDALNQAETVADNVDVSLLCSKAPNQGAQLLAYISVCGTAEQVTASQSTADQFIAGVTSSVAKSDHVIAPYRESPAYDFPGAPIPPPGPVPAYERCPLLGPDADLTRVADVLQQAMARAETPVRIDFEQMGGKVAATPRDATPFWNRDAKWSLLVGGSWTEPHAEQLCRDWVRETVEQLQPDTSGGYIVEAHPTEPDVATFVTAAFGQNLPRLAEIKHRIDPDNLFRCYYPLQG